MGTYLPLHVPLWNHTIFNTHSLQLLPSAVDWSIVLVEGRLKCLVIPCHNLRPSLAKYFGSMLLLA